MTCPCGSENELETCCGPFIDGGTAPTAEALLRSRYTAFTQQNLDYILATNDPETREGVDENATREWMENATWQGLEILNVEGGSADEHEASIDFIARFHDTKEGKDRVHRERATFHQHEGSWYYLDSRFGGGTVVRDSPKIGRNDPCPCGSGKKHKRCCLKG